MRRATHSAHPLSVLLIAFAITLCATATLALPPKAEAVIHLGDPNIISLSNGLVGYWPLDGQVTDWQTGKTSDLSGQGNTGQLRNMSTSTAVVGGKIGQSFKFDGTSSYVDLGDISAGDFGTADFLIAFWYKAPPGTGGYFLSKRGICGNASFWNIYVSDDTGSIGMEIDEDAGGTNYDVVDPGNISVNDNKWHHVIFTRKGSYIAEFLDGKLIAYDDPGFVTNLSNSASLYVGGNSPCGFPISGSLDDIRIYNRALSSAEIAQLYNLGTAKIGHSNVAISNGLVGYWTFDGATINWSTNVVSDISTQGATGTLVSMSKTSSPTPGRIGQALNFVRSSTQYVAMSSTTLFRYTAPFSYSVWVNPADVPSGNGDACPHYYPVISAEPMGWGWNLTLGSPNGAGYNKFEVARFRNSDSTWEGVTSNATYVPNTWYHVVAAFFPTKTNLYINGVLDNSADATEAALYYLNPGAQIGYEGCGATFEAFNGRIDDIRLYTRALSATEVKQLYNLGTVNVGHSNAMISNGLVGYWTFDGGSIDWHTNTVRDIAGTSTGRLISMSTTSSPIPGKIGQALKFNGSSSHTSIDDDASLHLTGSATYAFWFKANSLTEYSDLIEKDCGGYAFYYDRGTQKLYFGQQCTNPEAPQEWAAVSFNSVGSWHHVVGTYAAGVLSIYLDGRLANALSFTTTITSTAPLTIGSGQDGYFDGTIDDVRIYNRALSATEVKQLYNAGR